MRKTFLVLLAIVALAAFAVTGCNKKEAANTQTKESKKDMTVGFIYIGPVGDGGWTYAHDKGREYL